MNKLLKILAIAMLAVTLVGACSVLYGVNTLTPRIVQVQTSLTPATEAEETLGQALSSIDNGLFDGTVYGGLSGLSANGATFVTYTLRLENKGFFPAEWISLDVMPLVGDVLELGGDSANVLAPGTQGDIAVTLLTTLEQAQQPREIVMICYVFGRKQTARVQVN